MTFHIYSVGLDVYLQNQVLQCVASVMYAGPYYEKQHPTYIQLPFKADTDIFTEALGNFLVLSSCGS